MVDWSTKPLSLDSERTIQQISDFIEYQRSALGRDGILIGLSGGLDSAVVGYLSIRGVDKERMMLINLPDKDSQRRHRRDAALIAKHLDVPLQTTDITSILEEAGAYDLIPLKYVPGRKGKSWLVRFGKAIAQIKDENLLSARLSPKPDSLASRGIAYGMIKHRVRMVMLYQFAEVHNLLVVGAANKSEILTGTFTQWGCDQCADIMPIGHLYRSQIEKLAVYLEIPERIRRKPADPDIIPGVNDKEGLLGPYEIVDQILLGLESKVDIKDLVDQFGENIVLRVKRLYDNFRFMREIPYSITR
jgi:NAD+ synthase